MREENLNAINELVKKIMYIIDEKCRKLYYDKTFLTVVVEITNKGKYIIQKEGQKYPVTNATNFEFKVGDSVWVKIPSGILENMHICGMKIK